MAEAIFRNAVKRRALTEQVNLISIGIIWSYFLVEKLSSYICVLYALLCYA